MSPALILLILFNPKVKTDVPPTGTGFIVDNTGNYISDNTNTPIVYKEQ